MIILAQNRFYNVMRMLKYLRNIFSFSRGRRKGPLRDYFIATATQSNDRIRRLGLSLPPEGGSTILDRNRLSNPTATPEQDEEYKPSPYFDWVIDVDPGEGGFFAREDAFAIFDLQWRQRFRGASVYGLSQTNEKWTYALGDGLERFGRLRIGVDLLNFYDGADDLKGAGGIDLSGVAAGGVDIGSPDPTWLQDCFDILVKKLRSHRMARGTVEVSISEPVEAAALRRRVIFFRKP